MFVSLKFQAVEVFIIFQLQLAFEQGLLKPGLNVELPQPEDTIYDKVNS